MRREKRIQFLDCLRVMATCFVVMLHTISGALDYLTLDVYSFENRFSTIILDFLSCGVPVFLMISGYLFLDPARELSYKDVITKYCKRVVLALLLFGVPFACIELIVTQREFDFTMVGTAVWMVLCGKSWAHLWYLYLLLLMYLVTPLLRWVLMRIPGWAVWCVCCLLFLGCSLFSFILRQWVPQLSPVLPDQGIYLFYYLCGYLFRTGEWDKGKRTFYLFGAMAVFAVVGNLYIRTACDLMLRTAYAYPITVVLAVSLFGLGASGKKVIKNTGLLEKASALSFTVYLIHPVFINFYYKFLHITPYDYNLLWSIPVFFLAVMIPTVIGALILWRVKPLRKWVL